MLTPTQQEITDLYFNKDLTVSEIASEKNVTRQAVSECLKGCKKQLEEYESKLKICKRLRVAALEESFKLTAAARWVESFKTAHPGLLQEISELEAILLKDYFAEAEIALNKPEARELVEKDYTKEVYGRAKTGEE